ncbi:MAG: hypothetical protein GF331_08985, partial [Chitinivibrionales bacterium]|nr:hypothetical protein [Chitinivibrionales bacterium]
MVYRRATLVVATILAIASGAGGAQMDTLTGGLHTRVVWIEGGKRLYGGGRVMGYDSQLDSTIEILPASANQNKPLLCDGGNSVVVSIDYRVHVVDWAGGQPRFLAEGIASDVWVEPATGHEWVVIRAGVDETAGSVFRCRIDDPAKNIVLWDQSPAGDYYMNWYQLSADGRVACDFLPWNRCFVIDDGGLTTSGTRTGIGRGCWSSLAPDNSYHSVHFPADAGGHTVLRVYRYLEPVADIPLDPGPRIAGTTDECFHPRFASHGARYLTLTSGYIDSRDNDYAEVYLGRFNAQYTAFDGWVRVTDNLVSDYTPDAWVGVQPPSPSLSLSIGELHFTVDEDSGGTLTDTVTITTPHGQLSGPSAAADKGWLATSVQSTTDGFVCVNIVDLAALAPGRHVATVTVDDAAVEQPRTYRVVVTVTGTPVATSIAVQPAGVRVMAGDTARLSATVYDQSDVPLTVQPALTWLADCSSHSIDSTGLFVAGDSLGTCTVTVSTGALADTALVVVVEPHQALLTLTRPAAGDVYAVGQRMSIRWNASDPLILYVHVKVSVDNGLSWHVVSPRISKWDGRFGSLGWLIPDSLDTGDGRVSTCADSVLLGVFDFWDDSVNTVTAGPFTIREALRVTAPANDTAVAAGDTVAVEWDAADMILGVVVDVSPDEGENWYQIVPEAVRKGEQGWSSYRWRVPTQLDSVSLVHATVQLRVWNYADAAMSAIAPGRLTVTPPPIDIVSPIAGGAYHLGDTVQVSWRVDTARVRRCGIELSLDSGNTWLSLSDSTYPVPDSGEVTAALVIPDTLAGTVSAVGEWLLRVYNTEGPGDAVVGPLSVTDRLLRAVQVSAQRFWPGDTMTVSVAADSSVWESLTVWLLVDTNEAWLALPVSSSATQTTGSAVFEWAVRDSLDGMSLVSDHCRLRVCMDSDGPCVTHDSTFAIHGYPLVLVEPNARDTITVGDSLHVRWEADTARIDSCVVWLSLDNGTTWIALDTVGSGEDAWGSAAFEVRDTIGGTVAFADECRMRVTSITGEYEAISDAAFAIVDGAQTATGSDDSDCGCGTGTGLALLPPLWYRFRLRRRRRRRRA